MPRNRVADPGNQGRLRMIAALGTHKPDSIAPPVDVIDAQPADFAGTHTVDGQQQKDGVIPDRCRAVIAGCGEHLPDGFPCRTLRQRLVTVDAGGKEGPCETGPHSTLIFTA